MKFIKFLSAILVISFITGCASKDEIHNQTAIVWHNKIYKSVVNNNLDKADDYFTSLEVEHPNSQFIPIDLMILSKAHLQNQEYQLAEFYIDEYYKRYANKYQREWADYQKAKIKFFSFYNAYTNQKDLEDTINFVTNVINKYPNSPYIYELNTIKEKLEDTKIIFNNQIANLYKRLDKPKASKLYKINVDKQIIPPSIPWYKRLFYW
jgi:outer membrane protein assembly factor BamD